MSRKTSDARAGAVVISTLVASLSTREIVSWLRLSDEVRAVGLALALLVVIGVGVYLYLIGLLND